MNKNSRFWVIGNDLEQIFNSRELEGVKYLAMELMIVIPKMAQKEDSLSFKASDQELAHEIDQRFVTWEIGMAIKLLEKLEILVSIPPAFGNVDNLTPIIRRLPPRYLINLKGYNK